MPDPIHDSYVRIISPNWGQEGDSFIFVFAQFAERFSDDGQCFLCLVSRPVLLYFIQYTCFSVYVHVNYYPVVLVPPDESP